MGVPSTYRTPAVQSNMMFQGSTQWTCSQKMIGSWLVESQKAKVLTCLIVVVYEDIEQPPGENQLTLIRKRRIWLPLLQHGIVCNNFLIY